MQSEIVTAGVPDSARVAESLVTKGDLSALSPSERVKLYVQMCESLGLNPSSQPFAMLRLNGKEILYPTRGATDQLAAIHRVNREIIDGPKVVDLAGTKLVYAVCRASLPNGRTETATATVQLTDPVNVLMKCETKAKRRATLSILGLGMLDETELETIPAQAKTALEGPTVQQIEAAQEPARTHSGVLPLVVSGDTIGENCAVPQWCVDDFEALSLAEGERPTIAQCAAILSDALARKAEGQSVGTEDLAVAFEALKRAAKTSVSQLKKEIASAELARNGHAKTVVQTTPEPAPAPTTAPAATATPAPAREPGSDDGDDLDREIESLRSRLVECRGLDEVARAWLLHKAVLEGTFLEEQAKRACVAAAASALSCSFAEAGAKLKTAIEQEGSKPDPTPPAAPSPSTGSGPAASAKGAAAASASSPKGNPRAALTEDQEARFDEFLADLKTKRSHKYVVNSWRKHRREWDNDSAYLRALVFEAVCERWVATQTIPPTTPAELADRQAEARRVLAATTEELYAVPANYARRERAA